MKNIERKKFFPAICVFAFVAFSFVIANTFGDTYAASCPGGYRLTDGQCCPSDATAYNATYGLCTKSVGRLVWGQGHSLLLLLA